MRRIRLLSRALVAVGRQADAGVTSSSFVNSTTHSAACFRASRSTAWPSPHSTLLWDARGLATAPEQPKPSTAPDEASASARAPQPGTSGRPQQPDDAASTSEGASAPPQASGDGDSQHHASSQSQQPERPEPSPASSSEEVHVDFPQVGPQTNIMQPTLEEAEVQLGYAGCYGSTWFDLGPPEGLLETLAATPQWRSLKSLLLWPMYRGLGAASLLILSKIDGGFEEDEFLDGVRAAVSGMLGCWGDKDFASLGGMGSALLVERMKHSLFEYETESSERVTGMTAEVRDVAMTGANLWTPASVGQFDVHWAAEGAGNGNLSRSWLSVIVHVSATVTVQRCTPTGEALPVRVLEKAGSWLFLRGPLPRGYSSNVVAPWRVVAVC